MNLHRVLRAVEDWRAADRPSTALATTVRRVVHGSWVGDALRGSWLGHPLHPLMVTVPIGAWVSAALLDTRPGTDDAARALVGLGLAAAVPTSLLGLADFADLDDRQRRVGLVHALTNTAATTCLLASHRCRSRGAHTAGQVLTLVGLTALSAGGALGGHLSYAQGAGVHRWQGPDRPPSTEEDRAVGPATG